jgi:hypothetical protein
MVHAELAVSTPRIFIWWMLHQRYLAAKGALLGVDT